jgi:hypothetical protein
MRDSVEFDVNDFQDPNLNKGVYARFYFVPRKDEVASAQEGRAIFHDVEYIEIIAAGNANNIIRKPVRDEDRFRFRDQYEKFRQGDTEQLCGTPLTEVPWLTRSQVEELMYRKVRTVENLAEISDSACNVPGLLDLRRKAEAWLVKAKEAAPFTAMQAEMDALRAELDALKAIKTPAKQ